MSKKRGLTAEDIAAAAAQLADEVGFAQLTLAGLAERLAVKPPSLYNHVAGLAALHRLLLMRGLAAFGEAAGRAVMGKSGRDALRAMGHAIRSFAHARPGLYAATSQAHPHDDPEVIAAARVALYPLEQVLAGFGLHGDAAIHALRTLRSAVHGFVSLEAGGFGLQTDVSASFDFLLDALVEAVLVTAARPAPADNVAADHLAP